MDNQAFLYVTAPASGVDMVRHVVLPMSPVPGMWIHFGKEIAIEVTRVWVQYGQTHVLLQGVVDASPGTRLDVRDFEKVGFSVQEKDT